MFKRSILTTLVCSTFIAINAYGAGRVTVLNKLTTKQQKEMREILNKTISSQKLPSISIAATKGNTVIWYEASGYENKFHKKEASPWLSLYSWASVGKLATERMSYAESESGMLILDAPVGNVGSLYYPLNAQPLYMQRCLSSSQLNAYTSCVEKYGDPKFLLNLTKGCFDPATFSAKKTSKDNYAWVSDKSFKKGDLVFKDKKNDGPTLCRASYTIKKIPLPTGSNITMKKLLAHTSGIMHYDYLKTEAGPSHKLTKDAAAVKARRDKGLSQMSWAIPYVFPKEVLISAPGTAYTYSSFGYNLAGVVLENVTNKRYEDLLQNYTDKFGGDSIQPYYFKQPPKKSTMGAPYRIVTPYRLRTVWKTLDANAYKDDVSFKMASGGIMSNIVDLGRFCVAITNDGYFTKKGKSNVQHSGSHADRAKSLLVSKANKDGVPQCLVLMTNVESDKVKLESLRAKLEEKLIEMKIWDADK